VVATRNGQVNLLRGAAGIGKADEARALAAGFAQANESWLTDCLERAAGNPLFLKQLLQNVTESVEAVVPGSIRSLVLANIDRLEARDKRAAQPRARTRPYRRRLAPSRHPLARQRRLPMSPRVVVWHLAPRPSPNLVAGVPEQQHIFAGCRQDQGTSCVDEERLSGRPKLPSGVVTLSGRSASPNGNNAKKLHVGSPNRIILPPKSNSWS
jgi:hypothetical protein